jgi:eukaryotic-like serine/threonine-protein kinase
MMTAGGQVKLTDFGIAHVAGGTRLTGSGVIGTPAYMAPEQLQGLPVTPAVDLWALGVTLFDVVEGRHPFDRDTTAATFHAILMGELPVPACAPPLATVIAGLLVRDPAQRMTIARARPLLAAAAGQDAVDGRAGGTGTRDSAGAGAVTHPGGERYPLTVPAQAAANGYTAPADSPRRAGRFTLPPGRVIGGVAGVAVAGIAAAVIAATVNHGSTSSGTPGPPPTATGSAAVHVTGAGGAADSGPVSTTGAASAPPSAAATVPSGYIGHWQGVLADNTALQGPQNADLTITGGPVNTVVGMVSYPDAGCSYDLRLVTVQPASLTLYEAVKTGLCYSEYVVLTPSSTGLTETVYKDTPGRGQPDFAGPLTRAS